MLRLAYTTPHALSVSSSLVASLAIGRISHSLNRLSTTSLKTRYQITRPYTVSSISATHRSAPIPSLSSSLQSISQRRPSFSDTSKYPLNRSGFTWSTCRGIHSTSYRSAPSSSSTSSSTSSSARARQLDANFVRFKLSRYDAEHLFKQWGKEQTFAPAWLSSLSGVKQVDEAYLPFFEFNASISTRVTQARVGHRRTEQHYNPSTRKWETRTRIDWTHLPPERETFSAVYNSDIPQMQIYGAFKYRRDPIQVLKSPLTTLSNSNQVVTPKQMNPSDFKGREIDVFEMRLETAEGRVRDFIRLQETQKQSDRIRTAYQADEAEVAIEITLHNWSIRRIYQPAFVFHVQHLNQTIEVMVNAVSGAVSGQYIYDPIKVGAAVAIPSAAVLTFLNLFLKLHIPWALGIAVPAVIGGVIGQYWASIREYFRERKRLKEQEEEAQGARSSSSDASSSYTNPFRAFWQQQQETAWKTSSQGWNEQQRQEQRYQQSYQQYAGGSAYQQQQQQQQQQQYRYQAPPPPPPVNYYSVLGLKDSSASLDDIRTAFRAKSFETHPDVNKGNEAASSVKFREVLEAYQTLRDPKKRAAYDATLRRR